MFTVWSSGSITVGLDSLGWEVKLTLYRSGQFSFQMWGWVLMVQRNIPERERYRTFRHRCSLTQLFLRTVWVLSLLFSLYFLFGRSDSSTCYWCFEFMWHHKFPLEFHTFSSWPGLSSQSHKKHLCVRAEALTWYNYSLHELSALSMTEHM